MDFPALQVQGSCSKSAASSTRLGALASPSAYSPMSAGLVRNKELRDLCSYSHAHDVGTKADIQEQEPLATKSSAIL
eukprot:6181202-Pleurochrysis_carterae.AAC.3